jgi:hypothetical protein
MRRIPTVLLNESQLHQYVAEYLEELRPVLDDPAKSNQVEGPGERTAKAQLRQVAKVWGDVLNEEIKRSIKKRDALSGKTRKTAIRRHYWEGRLDALGLFATLVTAVMKEGG